MDKKIRSVFQSEFLKNIFTLLSGATIAQIITFISIPILTRFYSPQDFGYIALFLSIGNIIATAATGRFELAIMLPKEHRNALAIAKGTFKLIIYTSLISLIFIIILKNIPLFDDFIKPSYFYFIPISVFILASIKVLMQLFSRQKNFKVQANTKIIQTGTTASFNVTSGIFPFIKPSGLFIGHITGQFLQFILLFSKFYKKERIQLKEIDKNEIKLQLKKNMDFPYYSAPMGILNMFSVDILIYTLNLFYSTTMVGLYSNAQKVINYPLSVISQSFTTVFYQKISESNRKVKLYVVSYFSNFALAFIAVLPIIFWGEEIFSFALGSEWAIAGSIAKYLAPLTVAGFAMRSVSNIYSLTRKNKILLVWQIIYLILIIIVIFFSKSFNFEILLLNVSIFGSLMYIALAIMGYIIIKNFNEID